MISPSSMESKIKELILLWILFWIFCLWCSLLGFRQSHIVRCDVQTDRPYALVTPLQSVQTWTGSPIRTCRSGSQWRLCRKERASHWSLLLSNKYLNADWLYPLIEFLGNRWSRLFFPSCVNLSFHLWHLLFCFFERRSAAAGIKKVLMVLTEWSLLLLMLMVQKYFCNHIRVTNWSRKNEKWQETNLQKID